MSEEPIWIRDDIVLAIHNRQLTEHGGASGIRDKTLLELSLNAPKQRFHSENSSIEELAASYAFSLCQNHPFIDGNKRTAFICMRLFLVLNRTNLIASKEEKIHIMQDLAAGKKDLSELIGWIKVNTSSIE